MSGDEKKFPEGMVPLGREKFQFRCYPGVKCFTVCCRNVDLTLYPYDIIRLKKCLGVDSEEWMRNHSQLVKGDNPFFPTVKLKLTEGEEKSCPYLKVEGCSVYKDRPSACRTYPLEVAVDRSDSKGRGEEYYFLTDHSYCLGHQEQNTLTVKEWIRNQQLIEYNTMNGLWTEIDTLFRQNPWRGEGAGGEKQQLAFMVCYNIDGFRRFVDQHQLLRQFNLPKDFKKRIVKEDSELQKFGYEWLKVILGSKSSLIRK